VSPMAVPYPEGYGSDGELDAIHTIRAPSPQKGTPAGRPAPLLSTATAHCIFMAEISQ